MNGGVNLNKKINPISTIKNSIGNGNKQRITLIFFDSFYLVPIRTGMKSRPAGQRCDP